MEPKHVRRENIRDRLSDIRHEINMMQLESNGLWDDWLSPLSGGLTCIIMAAYDSMGELQRHHEKWGDKN